MNRDGITAIQDIDESRHLLAETISAGAMLRIYFWADAAPVAQKVETFTIRVLPTPGTSRIARQAAWFTWFSSVAAAIGGNSSTQRASRRTCAGVQRRIAGDGLQIFRMPQTTRRTTSEDFGNLTSQTNPDRGNR